MTKRAFLMSICEYYGAYNKAVGQEVANYLDWYDEKGLQKLYDTVTLAFSSKYGKPPDKAVLDEARKSYNAAHLMEPIGTGRRTDAIQITGEEKFCPCVAFVESHFLMSEFMRLVEAKRAGGTR